MQRAGGTAGLLGRRDEPGGFVTFDDVLVELLLDRILFLLDNPAIVLEHRIAQRLLTANALLVVRLLFEVADLCRAVGDLQDLRQLRR